jgi:hypothetical protein
MSRHQNAVQNHSIEMANRDVEIVAQFRYFGTAVTNRHLSLEEMKSRLNEDNACCNLSYNVLFSCGSP